MPSDNQLPPEEVARMEEALTRHYGEPVRPVSQYCNAFKQWAKALQEHVEAHKDSEDFRDKNFEKIVEVLPILNLSIYKSNLLYRLIYLGQPLRTKKCPEHDGHWVGCWFDRSCECQVGYDVTGWLPD